MRFIKSDAVFVHVFLILQAFLEDRICHGICQCSIRGRLDRDPFVCVSDRCLTQTRIDRDHGDLLFLDLGKIVIPFRTEYGLGGIVSPEDQETCIQNIFRTVSKVRIAEDIRGDIGCTGRTVAAIGIQITAVCGKQALCQYRRTHDSCDARSVIDISGTRTVCVTDPLPLGRDLLNSLFPADAAELSAAALTDALHRVAQTVHAQERLAVASASDTCPDLGIIAGSI